MFVCGPYSLFNGNFVLLLDSVEKRSAISFICIFLEFRFSFYDFGDVPCIYDKNSLSFK